MNSKSDNGKKGGKKTSASSRKKAVAPKNKKDLFEDAFEEDDWEQPEEDEFGADADLFDEAPKVKKQSGRKRNTGDDDFSFEDDLRGLGFLDDSYYDEEDDLY